MGDLAYLKQYLKDSGYKNLHSKYAKRLMPNEKDTLLEMLCKRGHVDMLKFVHENNLVANPSTYQNSESK